MSNIDNLTYGELKQIAAMFTGRSTEAKASSTGIHPPMPVIVCTDKRGVIFGYTTNHAARPIELTDARMCLYWSADVGGVFGPGHEPGRVDSRGAGSIAGDLERERTYGPGEGTGGRNP